MLAHDGAGAKEFLTPDFIQRGAGVLEHVKLVEHDSAFDKVVATALRYGRCMSVQTAVIADRWRALRSAVSSVVAVASLRSWRSPITSPCTTSDSTVQNRCPLPR